MTTKSLSIPLDFPFPSPKVHPLPKFHPKIQFPCKFPLFSLPQRIQFLRNQCPPKCQNPNDNNNPVPYTIQQEAHFTETREAISQFLQEFGISAEESNSIALNSPKYAKMLVDSVKDLEEWTSWKSGGDGSEFATLGFKEKVAYMAKEKGDNGKVAFLESLGLSLSSSMNAARYLHGESLPNLIHKVKFQTLCFFLYEGNIISYNDDKRLVGKYARCMMMNLSIPIDEDLQKTLSLFEKVEARRGGLDMLGYSDVTFRYLVESFPRILLLPIDSHLKPMMEFLESIGVPKERMREIFLLFPPVIICDITGINKKVQALKKVGAVDKDFGKMLLKYPWILSTAIQENYKEVVSFFHMEKVDKSSVDTAIRSWPHILGCSTSKLKVMVEQFAELGVRNKKLGQVISKSPQLLLRKPQEFLKVVLFLEDLRFDRETVGQVASRCPEIFAAGIEKTLKKKIEFLDRIGVSKDHLPRVIKKYPELLVSDVNRTILPRMKYLKDVGLSKKDIAFMVRRFSPLLGYSIDEVLRPKYEFLVNTMKKPVEDVVGYPRYFSYSLEKKIMPRFWVLKGRNIECSLKDMLAKNDEEFAADFMDC
ncbi:transcription termination factor MTERF [Salix suchowensis]|nr:transcription termination factor MTERF [Salix suchowensis]